MYILSCDGEIKSYSDEKTFGWWFKDIKIEENYQTQRIELQQVRSVDCPNVSHEISAKCNDCSNLYGFTPITDKLTELVNINDPTYQQLLLAIVNPAKWNETYQHRQEENNNYLTIKKRTLRQTNTAGQNIPQEAIFKVSNEGAHTNLRLYKNEPIFKWQSRINHILKVVKEDILEMQIILSKIKLSDQEDDIQINNITVDTIRFTKDVWTTKYLDNLLLLLNEDIIQGSIKKLNVYTSKNQRPNENSYIV